MTDKEKIIEILQNKPYGYSSYEDFADFLIANGFIIPVRCHDCIMYKQKEGKKHWGTCRFSKIPMEKDDFCSLGERKENG